MNALTLLPLLLAQRAAWPDFRGVNWIGIAIFIMVLAGVIGIVFLVIKATGVVFPAYIWQILMIVLAVVIGCVAVIFLGSLL